MKFYVISFMMYYDIMEYYFLFNLLKFRTRFINKYFHLQNRNYENLIFKLFIKDFI